MKKIFLSCLLAFFCLVPNGLMAKDRRTVITNGELWRDTDGNVVQAHGAGFLFQNGLWYMIGEDRSEPWSPDVNMYSSPDLVTWTFVGKIIKNGETTPDLGRRRFIERPKLLYCERTGQYVVWCHYEGRNYGASEAAVFTSDKVAGPYRLVRAGRPLGIKSRDCNVFQDADGRAYFISTIEENQHLGLFRLSDDYTEALSCNILFAHQSREAPAIARVGDRYYMLSSACTGWDPNQCKLSVSKSLTEGWSPLENVGDSICYDTQAASILTVKGTKQTTYLYVGDRWMDPGLPESKTIIFPVTFADGKCELHYTERFEIDFETGEWSDVSGRQ